MNSLIELAVFFFGINTIDKTCMMMKRMAHELECQSLIVMNKDDGIENTFCYQLFELGEFDEIKMQQLVDYASLKELADNEKDVLKWIIHGINSCFTYHKDANDYYLIRNYSKEIEERWRVEWEIKLNAVSK